MSANIWPVDGPDCSYCVHGSRNSVTTANQHINTFSFVAICEQQSGAGHLARHGCWPKSSVFGPMCRQPASRAPQRNRNLACHRRYMLNVACSCDMVHVRLVDGTWSQKTLHFVSLAPCALTQPHVYPCGTETRNITTGTCTCTFCSNQSARAIYATGESLAVSHSHMTDRMPTCAASDLLLCIITIAAAS